MLAFIIPIAFVLVFGFGCDVTRDLPLWRAAVEHADELQRETQGVSCLGIYGLTLSDKDDNLIYRVIVDVDDKSCCIWSPQNHIVASGNRIMSRKLYDALEYKLPSERQLTRREEKKLILEKISKK